MSHRFKMSIVMAVVTSLIIFLTSLLLITIVREKRVSDLADYTVHLSYQICQNEKIQQFLKEEISVTHKEDVQQILHGYIENDPFVNELTFIDRFGKIPIQVIGPEQEYQASHYRAVLSINDILHKGEPYLDEKSWEYFLPVQISETTQWGVLRVRWKPEATWKFFQLLKQGVVYTTGGSFLFIVLLAYSVFLRSYRREFSRMMKILSYVMGGDYSKRFDSQSYSSDLAEIATYFNRIMMDVEEEKKKNAIIDETLRQVERHCSEYRKTMAEKDEDMKRLRQEMSEGLVELFELVWMGVIIIDQDHRIHYMNEPAERNLRFAKIERSFLRDVQLCRLIAPMLQGEKNKVLDEKCMWSTTVAGKFVTCRIRGTLIPTHDEGKLFFLLLKEDEETVNRYHSSVFAERFIADILQKYVEGHTEGLYENAMDAREQDVQIQLQNIIQRISEFQKLEQKQFGASQSIRLVPWIRQRVDENTIFSPLVYVETSGAEYDISLHLPESLLSEFLIAVLGLLTGSLAENGIRQTDMIGIKSSVDEKGKPVIAFTIRNASKSISTQLQSLLEERAIIDWPEFSASLTLSLFEKILYYTVYQQTKAMLRVTTQYFHSASKDITLVRMTIRKHNFSSGQSVASPKEESSIPCNEMLQHFLTKT